MSRSIRKETSSLAFGTVGRCGGSSAGFVVAALNAASAASREVVVLRVLSEGMICVLALGLDFLKRKLGGQSGCTCANHQPLVVYPGSDLGKHVLPRNALQTEKLYRDRGRPLLALWEDRHPPVRRPTRSLPAQNCFRFHNQQRMMPIAEPSACQDPKAPIGAAQTRPQMPALGHNQLLPQTKVLRD
jgi:hypothetical protein